MSDRLTLYLHGTFALNDAQGGSVPVASQRAQGLLAILALEPGQRVTRARMATLLWGDRSEEQARASLRQELSALRRLLEDHGGDIIQADRLTVGVSPDAVALQPGTGVLLDGIDIRSEPFEDWLREARRQSDFALAPQPSGYAPQSRNPILAVLPFSDLAKSNDFFADGVVEEITGALARVRDFDVIARQSCVAVDRSGLDAPGIADALGADYLIEGSVRRAGARVRISVHLIDGLDGRLLWEERYDDALDDLFDLQDRIASQIAGAVSPNLRAAEIIRASSQPPADRSAYDLVLTAYPHIWAHRPAENIRAIDLLSKALKRDQTYALALAMKAWATGQQSAYMWSLNPREDMAEGYRLAEKAIAVAGDHAPTLTAIGAALSQCTNDIERSNFYIDKALAIDPNNAWAWMRRAWNGAFTGDVETALSGFDRAEQLSPLDPWRFNFTLGRASTLYRWRKDSDGALALIQKGLRQNPGAVWAWRMIVTSCFGKGDLEGARQGARKLLEHHPHITVAYLRACLPPVSAVFQPEYFDAFAASGIPEN